MTMFEALAAPFPPNEIEWRVGSTNREKTRGMALAYLTARHVMDRLDEVLGPGNWQDRYEFHGPRTICYLTLRIDGEWVTKADGAGDSDVEAEKGALSDALKRAAVKWGIGRYLYHLDSPWVAIEAYGKSYKIADSEFAMLARVLGGNAPVPKAPAPATAPKAQSREAYTTLETQIRACKTPEALNKWAAIHKAEIDRLPPDWQAELRQEFADHKNRLIVMLAGTP